MRKKHAIVWLTGQSRSGKTTLAFELQKKIGGIILDGDEMRESISLDFGFCKRDRIAHNMRIANLALVLARQMPVIISVIAPFRSVRDRIHSLIRPVWIYVRRQNEQHGREYPYEIPQKPRLVIDMDQCTPIQAARKIKRAIIK